MGKKREKSSKIVAKVLHEGSLTCHTLIEEIRDTTTLVIYPIKKFTEMKEGIYYHTYVDMPGGDWYFSLLKCKDKFQIVLHTKPLNETVLIGLHRSDGRIEPGIWDGTIVEDDITFYFGKQGILDPKKKLLHDGDLVMECMYAALPQESNILIRRGLQMNLYDLMLNSDVDLLCNDLQDLYLSSKYCDFEIVMYEESFKVHKFIICARSNYFERLLRLVPELGAISVNFDIDPIIMHWLLLYIYSGKLEHLEADDMCEILEASCYLEIPCAIRICIHFLKNNLSLSFIEHLAWVMRDYDLRELGNSMVNFLNMQPKDILRDPTFKVKFDIVLVMLDCMGLICHPSVYNAVRHA